MNSQAMSTTSIGTPAMGLAPLSARALRLARVFWWLGTLVAVLVFAAGVPITHARLLVVCPAPDCAFGGSEVRDLQAAGLSVGFLADYFVAIEISFSLIWFVTGLFLFLRGSSDPMTLFVSFFIVVFGSDAYSSAADIPVANALLHLLFAGVAFVANMLSFLFCYLFPDGRFVLRWTRFAALAVFLATFLLDFLPGLPLSLWLASFAELMLSVTLLSCAAAQIYRYWRFSNPLQRQQTKVVVAGLVAAVGCRVGVALLESYLPHNVFVLAGLNTLLASSLLLIPLSVAVAILRYRLWDVDFLINRALLYTLLTLSVAAVYVLVVGSLGALFQAGNNLLIALLATGLVAVLFQPLRERLQRAVNHLVYGERDDPYAVLSRLGQRLEAASAPGATLNTIVETVAQALKLPYVAIVLGQSADQPAAAYGRPWGELARLPLQDQGEQVGELLLSPRTAGRR